jgi:peptidoglycan/xylan/chitin deacetylase (PgdA/CDA1 family)
MRKAAKTILLRTAKLIGLFDLARRMTARDLRILCYHGAALRDEHRFRPSLFISKSTFEARLQYLARQGYPVLSLETALKGLEQGDWPDAATVITIDDGWFGTYQVMAPTLRKYGFPATLYVASYYLEKQTQVFNVATGYALWRARDRTLDLSRISDALMGTYELSATQQRDKACAALNTFAESLKSGEQRQELFRKLCTAIGVDSAEIEQERICAFLRIDEARELERCGIDIQLHTHRHRFPADNYELANNEIDDNRKSLAPLGDKPRRHFCYPSGEYEEWQLPWLKSFGIESATTVKPGFSRSGSSPYELRRILDREDISLIEFEAEMCGFLELVRRCRSLF